MRKSINSINQAAVFTALSVLISCRTSPDTEVQPDILVADFTVLSSNEHRFTPGVAFYCPDGTGGVSQSIYYTIKLSPMDYEQFEFDSLWIAWPPKDANHLIYAISDTIIAYDLINARAQSFKLSQIQDRNTPTLTACYFTETCRGLKIDTGLVETKLPITSNTVA